VKRTDVIITGAGLTGLTLAFYLKKRGLDVIVIEKGNRIGGVIETINQDGFTIEAGPNTGVLAHPEVAELFDDLAGQCSLETADPEAKRRLIWKSGQWHALPGGLTGAIKTPLFSFIDKLGILGEPFRPKGKDPFETLESLVLRRLGRSYLDYAVDPFISGIYAGDPSYLVTRYALPKLYALEQNYGSFIGGAVKKSFERKDQRMKKATREVFSAVGGLGALVKALGNEIGEENIILNAGDPVIKPGGNKFTCEVQAGGKFFTLDAAFVVSTVDAVSLPALMPFLTPRQLSPVTNLEYAPVAQVVLGFNNWQGGELNAFGGLVPVREKRKILGVLFTSSFFKNRAPLGGALLSVFIGGTRRPELVDYNDDEIRELVFGEVNDMFGLTRVNPDIFRVFRYRRAIPQYGRSSAERLQAIIEIQSRYPGLILAGGIRDGIGMADRIRQAKTIADEIWIKSL
jgi:protoporphyrinogen/coproporphyrinogen III oxidase